MNEINKSLLAAAGVVACASAVVAGSVWRSRIDLGGAGEGALVALNGNQRIASNEPKMDVPAADYFFELSEKLKKEYVEPIKDEQKMASGAVRGMVASLGDPKSLFMGKDEFQAYLRARQGTYEGIGVDLSLVVEAAGKTVKKPSPGDTESNEASAEEALVLGFKIPRVLVTNVVPGGPADRAGVKAGDMVYGVDDHWVANTAEVAGFRKAQAQFLDKKITRDVYNSLYKALRKKMDRALMPTKVTERLIVGKSGSVKVEWLRNGTKLTTTIERAASVAPKFSASGNTIRLPFTEGSAEELRKAIDGKTDVTLDLRNNVSGDFNEMRAALAAIAPTGKYGTLSTERKDKPELLMVDKGNSNPPKVTLLVDKTTSGAAEIFALALSSKGRGKLTGGQMGGDRTVRQVVQLPDGAGYTLVTGVFKPQLEENTVVAKGGKA